MSLQEGEKAEAHTFFHLTAANDGQLPVKMYLECNLDCMGYGSKSWNPYHEGPKSTPQSKALQWLIDWNWVCIAYEKYMKLYGT